MNAPAKPPKPPVFSNHGCRLNAYETEAMKALAAAHGVEAAVVVNTCAVTQEAVRKARQDIRKLRRAHPEAKLIVTGCAAQTDADSFAAMPEVDHVIGNHEKMQPSTWAGLSTHNSEPVQVDDIMSVTETAGHLIDGFGTRSRAYVQVQNGCDHRCTFCIIPFGRGNSRSVPAGVVVDQVNRLVAKGFNEVVLTGVDLTSWGADMPGQPRLGDLVMRLLKLTDVPRLRISSIDSIEVDDALMQAIAEEPRLMPHLHLSLQHGDDLILKRMKRRHLRDDAIRFCTEARGLRPEMTFGADIIAGFPTETEAMFDHSLALVKDCDLTWLHVFPYSPRPGTPAARMPQVDGGIIKARATRLRQAGQRAVETHLHAQIGKTHDVLMENAHMGRTAQFAEVTFDQPQPVGQIVRARNLGGVRHAIGGMTPVLYSFRRCPYAIRARLALHVANQRVEIREVLLRDKAPAFLAASPSATVPCLVTADQTIDESLDVMIWALSYNDPDHWRDMPASGQDVIALADGPFKQALDRTKYHTRYGSDPEAERAKAMTFLAKIDASDRRAALSFGVRPSLADMAILPFVRQFAFIDKPRFDAEAGPCLRRWLDSFLTSDRFAAVMEKLPVWQEGDAPRHFP